MPTKVCIVKPMVFPIVLYRCESWTLKKAECWRIDAFKLWCWRRFLIVPWTARRSNLSILNKITPEFALEGLMLKPDWPPDLKSQLIGNDPDAVKDWRQEKGTTENKKVAWHHWLDGHEFEQTPGHSGGWGNLVCCRSRGLKESATTDSTKTNELRSFTCAILRESHASNVYLLIAIPKQ